MENKRIGCSTGKTVLVDPNTFDGQSSSTNVFVPLEDLNISVQLEASKKGRTILTSNSSNENTSEGSKNIKIKFIDGSLINGEKVLTTKYTELTTILQDSNETENLGITNIDIDFNSSFAPLITINFIDIRGSAIFQNEENIKDNDNPLSIFFQLPYPIFELTVKGYYGMPVKYCLHMTKFTTKFNSQTGNFEIMANFVGYTYAMLSDMLLGYLKAIAHTKLGKEKYAELRKTRPELLTLNELMIAISKINDDIKKISSTDEDVIEINNGELKLSQLDVVNTNINILAKDINNPTIELDEFNFIVYDSTISNESDAKAISWSNLSQTNSSIEKIKNYNININESIRNYNEKNSITIISTDFTNLKQYSGLSLRLINLKQDPDFLYENNKLVLLHQIFTNLNEKDLIKIREDLFKYISKNYVFGSETNFNVYDLRNQYSIIRNTRKKISEEILALESSVAKTLKENVAGTLTFDSTVRNIIEIFTISVEVLLSVIYDVSASALKNSDREKQLDKFKTSYDIKNKSVGSTPITSPGGALTSLYYPWPSYNYDYGDKGIIETYLGKYGVGVDIPSDVNELEFIDDLLNAFIKSQADSERATDLINNGLTNWFPINPIDTRLFIDSFPYARIEALRKEDVINLVMIRAMVYLGLTNKGLSPAEIEAMANNEADGILKDISNEKILEALSQVTNINDYLSSTGKINGVDTNVIKKIGDEYYYDYIITGLSGGFKTLPINSGFTGNWSLINSDLVKTSKNGNYFLTNYTTTDELALDGTPIKKPNDGGVYVKIMNRDDYYGPSQQLPSPIVSANPIEMSKLQIPYNEVQKDGANIGFNQFGGVYGTQEFSKLNFGVEGLTDNPFMYMFYEDANYGDYNYNKSNGLGLKRALSGINNTTTRSPYDINKSPLGVIPIADEIDDVMKFIDGDEAVHKNYGKNRILLNTGGDSITYPYINFQVIYDADDDKNLAPVSLFGSRLYYEQIDEKSKALLFLHTLPWNGLVEKKIDSVFGYNKGRTIFNTAEIINTFGNRGGFISAPKLWAAFIGAMLWRSDFSTPILDVTGNQIGGGSTSSDPILFKSLTESFIPTLNLSSPLPTKLQYLTKRQNSEFGDTEYPESPMVFSERGNSFVGLPVGNDYKELGVILLKLPEQVKDEFKRIFFTFVFNVDSASDWEKIKSQLEIFTGDGQRWKTDYDTTISSSFKYPSGVYEDKMVIPYSETRDRYTIMNADKNNFDNYIMFTPILEDESFKYNYLLELKDNTYAVSTLINMLNSEVIIANSSYKIWQLDLIDNKNIRENIKCSSNDLKIYLDAIITKLTPKNTSNKKKEREQAIFGTDNEDLIKLQLYNTCKNIYDKWVGGSDSVEDLIFQGACSGRNSLDSELAKKYRGEDAKPTFIDSFRFVSRSFKDIGNELIINPLPVGDILRNNPNTSFYDSVTSLLSSNNFDFIPLPSYINYGDEKELQSMFKPVSYNESFSKGVAGPSFVCVYIGKKSKHLDFNGSEYKNDGFDFKCDENNNLSTDVPKDMLVNAGSGETNIAVFAVNFSQQNQNIFKDITLDQSEFSETSESLQIIDDISRKGAENNRTLAGQNIYNVYSVRSYKTEVEMMGNAMIQPMMYFQLNNIPMFHGAYLITHVRHNIKPNFMSTHFTGVRISKTDIKLMDSGELFMSLLDSIDSKNTGTKSFGSSDRTSSISGSTNGLPPIVRTIIANSGINGNIVSGYISTSPISSLPNGILNNISDSKFLLTEAVPPLNAMLTDWIIWMKNNGFNGNSGNYAYINSAFRSYQQQQTLKDKLGSSAAVPGTSNHGWGIAIDFQFFRKNGTVIKNYDDESPNVDEGYNFNINESLVWLLENSYRYGWIIPEKLRDNKGLEEFWHFEYHGKSAACILSKKNVIKGLVIKIDMVNTYHISVTNPKDETGKIATYDNCDYENQIKLDGTDICLVPTNQNIIVTPPSTDDIDFYTKVINGVGAVATSENLKFFYAWRKAEGGLASWNPLNTTLIYGNSSSYNCQKNGASVKNYLSKDDGIKATILTLKSRNYYSKILVGLQTNIGSDKLSKIVDELQTWGTSKGINDVLAGKTLNTTPIANSITQEVNC